MSTDEPRSPYREVVAVSITIEPTGAEFRIESSDAENGWQTEDSLTSGVVWLLHKYAKHIATYGVTHFDNANLIGLNGQTVGRITIEREENTP